MVSLNEAKISELDHVQVAVYNVESGGQEIDFNEIDFPIRYVRGERIFMGKRSSRCAKRESRSGY